MNDLDGDVLALLDRAALGPVGEAPITALLAGGRRLRRRRVSQVAAIVVAVAAIVVASVVVVAGPTGRSAPAVTATPIPGPSAEQLAHGHWVAVPPAPIKLCNPQAVWASTELIAFEGPFNGCPPVAAAFNPRTVTWTTIAAPPRAVGVDPVAAWGGGRLVLVSNKTGAAFAWTANDDRWRAIARVPAGGVDSLTWTGRAMVAITATQTKTSRAFILSSGRWQALPDLPRPRTGAISGVNTVVDHGALFAYAAIYVHHDNPSDSYVSGHVQLLRLGAGRWIPVSLGPGIPKSQVGLTQITGAVLVTGSICAGACTEEDAVAALLRPGAHDPVTVLHPPAEVPYPYDIAGGGGAVVVTYPNGPNAFGENRLPGSGPAPGTTAIYDVAAGAWLRGPTIPDSHLLEASIPGIYWTPFGVIALETPMVGGTRGEAAGSWLLRPGP